MIKLIAILAASVIVSAQALAHEGFELGIAAGTSHALTSDSFKQASKTGDANQYWIGYGFDKNWGAEIGLDSFDFDGSDLKSQAITAAGTYDFLPEHRVHPLAKLGAGTHEMKNTGGGKHSSAFAKAALGLEADFRYVSVGALFNYLYMHDVISFDGSHSALVPALFLSIHEARDGKTVSKSEAPLASVVSAKKDSDGDGVVDDEDKCPNTKGGLEVNGYGCSFTEKASVKLQLEFANGNAVLDSKFEGEIKSLADFMAQYPNTKAEIAGHTDNVGKLASNNSLSQKRADSVKNALIKAGVDEKRLTSKGYGPKQPIADNATTEGRQANRRVMAEISVTTEKKK